jgi:hypothetical protein
MSCARPFERVRVALRKCVIKMNRLGCGLVGLLLLATPFAVVSHTAVAGCLSQAEARKLWPNTHLYWHTAAHCWDASRKGDSAQRLVTAASSGPGMAAEMTLPADTPKSAPILVLAAEEPPPYAWLDASSWLPISRLSFENQWNDAIGELKRLPVSNRLKLSPQ